MPAALSNGFQFARGEFWTWTSADNLMGPEQLLRQVEFLRANPQVAMVYADYLAIDDRGRPLSDRFFRRGNRKDPADPEIHLPRTTARLLKDGDNFIGPCFMYRGWVGAVLGDYDAAWGWKTTTIGSASIRVFGSHTWGRRKRSINIAFMRTV